VGILKNLTNYAALTQPLLEKRLKNRPRFSTIKVTDHHAIIPTGIQSNLQYNQQQVYDSITKRFTVFMTIVWLPILRCRKAADILFKTTGKEILKKGFRVVFEDPNAKKRSGYLESFVVGEKGPHQPSF
jgi:DNA topoisomerase-3